MRWNRLCAAGMAGLLAGAILAAAGCRKDPALTDDGKAAAPADAVQFTVPAGWPQPRYAFAGNTPTPEGFALGRDLFYEPLLSRDSSVSCGFCHQPEAAFANSAHIVSHGVDNKLGTRNAPGLSNLAWHPDLMWDGGVVGLENQPIVPIQNPVEMDLPIDQVIARLAASPTYRQRFEAVFGPGGVTYQRMARALVQFMGTMVSAGSKWDGVQAGTAAFTASEAAGQAVFQQHCAGCHQPPLFSDFSFRNNGLRPTALNDSGRAHITRDAADLYHFKVPSLRNLSYTAPYFHDGRAATVDAALAHYTDTLVRRSLPGTDGALQGGVALTEGQRSDLRAFLKTLDDPSFIANKAFHER